MIAVLQFDAASAACLKRLADEGRLPNLERCAPAAARSSWRARPSTSRPAPTRRSTGGWRWGITASSILSSGLPPRQSIRLAASSRPRRRSGSGWRRRGAARWRSIPTSAMRPGTAMGSSSAAGGCASGSCSSAGRGPRGRDRALRRRHGRPPDVTEVFGAQRPAELRRLRERFLAAPARVADAALEQLGGAQLRPRLAHLRRAPPRRAPALGGAAVPAGRRASRRTDRRRLGQRPRRRLRRGRRPARQGSGGTSRGRRRDRLFGPRHGRQHEPRRHAAGHARRGAGGSAKAGAAPTPTRVRCGGCGRRCRGACAAPSPRRCPIAWRWS